ncbi:hypothetical protein [Erwinia oleae]|uniref:hypothetical protein n=1 Tax=Erwinia oleae TaxID=796334 RepID=UPI0005504D39|nr:hypothetical protein [Erwinia oleae]
MKLLTIKETYNVAGGRNIAEGFSQGTESVSDYIYKIPHQNPIIAAISNVIDWVKSWFNPQGIVFLTAKSK